MIETRALDLVCVSCLADAEVLRVASYPRANGGAVVERVDASIAADGPLTAITAAQLGMRVGLVANAVGTDLAGQRLLEHLTRLGIRHTIAAVADTPTPRLTVVVDDTGTRTWFASLQRAPAELQTANLHLLTDARLIYLDCYRVLTGAAGRALTTATGTPLLLNLGGDLPDDSIIAVARDRRITAVQTSVDETDACDAEDVAAYLFERMRPDAAVVTMGRLGALARTRTGVYRAAAPPVVVTHTHGAGAAFSAGYAHARLAGADVESALRAACELGAAHCANPAVPAAYPHTAPCAVA